MRPANESPGAVAAATGAHGLSKTEAFSNTPARPRRQAPIIRCRRVLDARGHAKYLVLLDFGVRPASILSTHRVAALAIAAAGKARIEFGARALVLEPEGGRWT